jgi:hypothetical protein
MSSLHSKAFCLADNTHDIVQDVVNIEDHLSWHLQIEAQAGHYFGKRG